MAIDQARRPSSIAKNCIQWANSKATKEVSSYTSKVSRTLLKSFKSFFAQPNLHTFEFSWMVWSPTDTIWIWMPITFLWLCHVSASIFRLLVAMSLIKITEGSYLCKSKIPFFLTFLCKRNKVKSFFFYVNIFSLLFGHEWTCAFIPWGSANCSAYRIDAYMHNRVQLRFEF